ncbi:unnamed protein product [Orchesella dallaii]|uniref:SKP1 component POZ domain-containing protein n=1 Tax=Orchesella dallaii TaxID=48710 RepID=A0ABP1RX80_9HEXA
MADRKVLLQSSDLEIIDFSEIYRCCNTFMRMFEVCADVDEDDVVPVNSIHSSILMKIKEWGIHHKDDLHPTGLFGNMETFSTAWDMNFVFSEEPDILLKLFYAAEFLEIFGLLHIIGETLDSMVYGRTSEEVQNMFNITDDFRDFAIWLPWLM